MSLSSAFDVVMGPNMIGPSSSPQPELQGSHFSQEKC